MKRKKAKEIIDKAKEGAKDENCLDITVEDINDTITGMSHTGAIPKYKQIDEYEGKGPRPPIPGEECRLPKMTECNSSAKRNYNCEPVAKWHKGLLNLLSDEIGVKLLYNYIETVAGKHHEYWHFLNFYFTCVGLKTKKDENEVRAIINSIYK